VNEIVKNQGRCCARHRRWLLAVALLAGGTGIGLGGVLGALLAGMGISPLVWVSLAGRLVATGGIVFAWSRLETRPMAVRLFRAHVERLVNARGTGSRGLGRTERTPLASLRDRFHSRLDRLRLHWRRSGRPGHRRGGRNRTAGPCPRTSHGWLPARLDRLDRLDRLGRIVRPGTALVPDRNRRVQDRSASRARSQPRFRRRDRSRSRSRSRRSSPPLPSPSPSNTRSILPERVGTLLARAPVVVI